MTIQKFNWVSKYANGRSVPLKVASQNTLHKNIEIKKIHKTVQAVKTKRAIKIKSQYRTK